MGGTTAKASMVEDGQVMRAQEYAVGAGIMVGSRLLTGAGYTLKVPAIDLAEVGAGGGSHVWIDAGGALQVGPQSAGAAPGPVCYDAGGTVPTVTDANVILGLPEPRPSRRRRPEAQCREGARRCSRPSIAEPLGMSLEAAAYGAHQIAASNMIRAIKAVSTERGRDPREFALFAFGGNGPLFACGMAAALGIGRVIVPPAPGLFSSFGLLYADVEHHYSRSFRRLLRQADLAEIERAWGELAEQAARQLAERRLCRRARPAPPLGGAALQGPELRPRRAGARRPDRRRRWSRIWRRPSAPSTRRTYGHRAGIEEPVELVAIQVVGQGVREGAERARAHGLEPGRARAGAAAPRLFRRARLDRDADAAPLRPRHASAPARSSSRSTMPPAWSRRARLPSSTARAAS